MPSRAARWISAMTLRSKRYDSRRPGRQPIIAPRACQTEVWHAIQRLTNVVSIRVVDPEVVEAARGSVAAELARVDVVDPGPLEQPGKLRAMLVAELLLDAVGAEPGHAAADVEARLVD